MENKKVAVVGCFGKMGSVCLDFLKRSGYDVVGVGKDDDLNSLERVDVLVDFSEPEMTGVCADWCKNQGVKLIVGTTGLDEDILKKIEIASKVVPVVVAGNFSCGVVKLKQCLKVVFDGSEQQVIVFEKHHKNKKDKPSGTAKELLEEIEKLTNAKVEVLCERVGKEVGTHRVDVYFENEVISLSHRAYGREVFAAGVAKAVQFLQAADVGLYAILDIM